MKKAYKTILLSLTMLICTFSLASCTQSLSIPDNTTDVGYNPSGYDSSHDDSTIDLPAEPLPLTQTPALPIILTPIASGARVEQNEKAKIDYSNAADGYVMVMWLVETTRDLKVQVTGPSEAVYTYTIYPNNEFNALPLSDGNGSYAVRVYEQNDEGRYFLVLSLSLDVTLVDEFAPFLRPNKFVNFNESNHVVRKAAELVAGKNSFIDKIEAVYSFVIDNFDYDVSLAESILAGTTTTYIPDLDAVYDSRIGICFDYAAVMTAMLRSQGIPTKMVFGYADDVRHAWINVFSEETGWVDQVIFFDGENWIFMDPTFASAAGNASALQQFIGDGSRYTATHLY